MKYSTERVQLSDVEYDFVERIVDGQRLRAYSLRCAAPDAPTVAMVHGLEGSWDNWCSLASGCFDRFNVFSLDLPWSGRDGYYWCHTRAAHEWLHAAFDLLPSAPAVVVAHSYGVNVVLDYLQRRTLPDLAGLVLVSAFYRASYGEKDWTLFDRCLQSFRAILSEGITLRRGREFEPELLSAMVDAVLDHVGPAGFTECFSHFVRTPSLQLDRIDVPAVVIAGDRDPGATASDNAALAAALPNASFELLRACGHFCMIEHPRLVQRTVSRFLTERVDAVLSTPRAGAGGSSL